MLGELGQNEDIVQALFRIARALEVVGLPRTLDFKGAVQGANQTTTSASYVDVTGASTTITTGDKAETWVLVYSIMFSNSVSSNLESTLSINGTDQDPNIYTSAAATSIRLAQTYVVTIPAGTTYTIKARIRTSTGTATVNLNNASFVPTIRGVGVAA